MAANIRGWGFPTPRRRPVCLTRSAPRYQASGLLLERLACRFQVSPSKPFNRKRDLVAAREGTGAREMVEYVRSARTFDLGSRNPLVSNLARYPLNDPQRCASKDRRRGFCCRCPSGELIVPLFSASRITAALSLRDHEEPVMPPRAFEPHAGGVWRSALLTMRNPEDLRRSPGKALRHLRAKLRCWTFYPRFQGDL